MRRWRDAFLGAGPACDSSLREDVVDAICEWNSSWEVETDNRGYIINVRDEGYDTIWDTDADYSDSVEDFFSESFVSFMDTKFTKGKKVQKFLGSATKLPLPGSGQSPNGNTLTHSGRDISSSSN